LASPRKSPVLPPGVAHSRQSAILMLVGLIAATAPLPYSAAAVVPLLWAGVESIRSIQARSTAQTAAPEGNRSPTRGIVAGVVGLVLVCVLTVMVLLPYAFYGMTKALQDCTLGANTAIAAADCNVQFNASLSSIMNGLLSSGQHAGG
jgi:hypothetical protein